MPKSNRFNLSREKFEKLTQQARKLEPVRCNCNYSASVKIHYAFYGPVGVRVECNKCSRVGPMQMITEAIATTDNGGSIGTPVTERSLMKGIKSAVRDWDRYLAIERRLKSLNE